jgi:hypothetical protein
VLERKHKIGDLIQDNTSYGDGMYGVVIGLRYEIFGEYDMLVKWTGYLSPQWSVVDNQSKLLFKIIAGATCHNRK